MKLWQPILLLTVFCLISVSFAAEPGSSTLGAAQAAAASDSTWADPFTVHDGKRSVTAEAAPQGVGFQDPVASADAQSAPNAAAPDAAAAAGALPDAISVTKDTKRARRSQQDVLNQPIHNPDNSLPTETDALASATAVPVAGSGGRSGSHKREERKKQQGGPSSVVVDPKTGKNKRRRGQGGYVKPRRHGDVTSPGAHFQVSDTVDGFGSPRRQHARRNPAGQQMVDGVSGDATAFVSRHASHHGRRKHRRFFKPTHKGNTEGEGAHFTVSELANSEAAREAREAVAAERARTQPTYAPARGFGVGSRVHGYTKKDSESIHPGRRVSHMPRNYYQSQEGHGRRVHRPASHKKAGAKGAAKHVEHKSYRITAAQQRKIKAMREQFEAEREHEHDHDYDESHGHRNERKRDD